MTLKRQLIETITLETISTTSSLNWENVSYLSIRMFTTVKCFITSNILYANVWCHKTFAYLCSVIIKQAITIKNIQS